MGANSPQSNCNGCEDHRTGSVSPIGQLTPYPAITQLAPCFCCSATTACMFPFFAEAQIQINPCARPLWHAGHSWQQLSLLEVLCIDALYHYTKVWYSAYSLWYSGHQACMATVYHLIPSLYALYQWLYRRQWPQLCQVPTQKWQSD